MSGHGVEALALARRAKLPASPFLLELLASLGLHVSFLNSSARPPRRLSAELGRALLETGAVAEAVAPLLRALEARSNWRSWLNAAAALAIIDPERPRHALAGREDEPVVALLLSHLAERAGDVAMARRLAGRIGARVGWPAEADLLRSTIAIAEGDRDRGKMLRDRALGRYSLAPFEPAATPCGAQDGLTDGPLVSIIVAAFNARTTIETSLRSLLTQSWRRVEVLMVDDCSTDGTADLAERLAASDSRLRVLRLARNCGAYAARNVGLAEARGEFVSFHDADDAAHSARIARQLAPLLANPALVATTARWIRCDETLRTRDRQILPAIRFHTGSVVVRRTFERAAVGGFDPVRFGADGDFLARLRVAAGRGVLRMNIPLTFARVHHASAVHDPESGYGSRGHSPARIAYREESLGRLVLALAGD